MNEAVSRYITEKYYYDEEKGEKPVLFIENFLCHYTGKDYGKPYRLMEWQKDMLRTTYGIHHKDTHKRRFQTVYLKIPRKNSKTTTVCFMLLLELLTNPIPNSTLYLAANARDQAAIALKIMKGIIDASPLIKKRLRIYHNCISNLRTGTSIRTQSRDAKITHGTLPLVFAQDEVSFAEDDALYSALSTGQGTVEEPLAFLMGTASPKRSGWAWDFYQYMKQIHDNPSINETILPLLFVKEPEDDWEDEATWYKCNPSLGHTINITFLRNEYQKAKEFPSYAQQFRLFYLNEHVSEHSSFIAFDDWEKITDKKLKMSDFLKEPCWCGLDLSNTQDITCLSIVFERDGNYYLFNKSFLPSAQMEKRVKTDKVNYDVWADQGHITLTHANDGVIVDYDTVANVLMDIMTNYDVRQIGYDPWNASHFINRLNADGVDRLIQFRQGFLTMSPAIKNFIDFTLSKKLQTEFNPLMDWCIQNVVLTMDASANYKFNKAKSSEKIDLAVASTMALQLAIQETYVEEQTAEVLFL